MAPKARKPMGTVHLLDGNVLYALIDEAHVHHRPAQQWFAAHAGGFATCPITQGTLLRLAMRLGGRSISQALAVLDAVTAHARHHFWPDALAYGQVRWQGVPLLEDSAEGAAVGHEVEGQAHWHAPALRCTGPACW